MNKELELELEQVNEKINYLLSKVKNDTLTIDEKEKLHTKIDKLLVKKREIVYENFILDNSPHITNKIIDLVSYHSNNRFDIYDSKTKSWIGYISYIDNNICYYIDCHHRGKNYSLMALELLTDKLYKDGIKEVLINVYDDNIASIKIAKKFGGIEISPNEKNMFCFKCDLNTIKNNKRTK